VTLSLKSTSLKLLKSMKNRLLSKYKVLLLAGLFVLVFSISFLYLRQEGSLEIGSQNLEQEKEISSVHYKSCYVLVGDFGSYQKGINFSELKGAAVTAKEEAAELLEEQGFENVSVFDDGGVVDLYTFVGEGSGYALASPWDVDYRVKSLSVDGLNFWNKDTLKEYPLCFEKVSETGQEELYELDGELYDFDVESIGSIFLGGEIIPARAVDRTWLNQSDNYTLLFDRLKEKIVNSDLAFAMLENPISGNPTPCRGCMIFVGDEKNAQGFKQVGFDGFGIGNHFGDGGKSAIERTISVLETEGIALAGASVTSLEEAAKAHIFDMNGKKVALLSAEEVAAYYWFGGSHGTNYYSGKSSSGGVGSPSIAKITQDIESAKAQADIVIVMMSWGTEYTNESNSHQKALAHALIDAGADMIVGSHPHWVQEIEIYEDKPIFYSLGNFIFDQTGEGTGMNSGPDRRNGETRQGMTMQAFYMDGKLVSIDLIPHKMCGYEQAGGESNNRTHNLAWKIQAEEMSYNEVDQIPESQGCVWYQPTPVSPDSSVYKAIWDRMMEHSNI